MRESRLMPAVILAGAGFLWYVASNFRGGVGRYEVLGPSFFPKLLLAGLVVVTVLDLARTFVGKGKKAAEGDAPRPKPFHWPDFLLAFAITIAFVGSLSLIGFLPATILFQFAVLWVVFRQRSWIVTLGTPLLLTAMFFVIFSVIMNVPLPRGAGIFYTFSRLIY